MKYNGIELKEITEPQIFDQPKKMFVWNNVMQEPTIGDVVAIVRRYDGICAMCFDGECYPYCAEPRRLTNREFSRWLVKGYGECRSSSGCADTAWMYDTELDDKPVVEWAKARKWDDSEWHEPTVEYCKQLKPEKVEELESLIRSAENIFDILSKREIILMWNKFTDHYSVMIKDK